MLSSDKCYMLDCETPMFVWLGRTTLMTERRTSISAVEEYMRSEGRSMNTQLTVLTEGSETVLFRSFFSDWPDKAEIKLYEEGRGKVAAIFKHQGYEVKELPDEDEEVHVLVDLSGETKVWRVDGDATYVMPVAEPTIFYSGDCYIIQHRYPTKGREEDLFYAWLGKNSVMEDKVQAISHMNAFVNSSKGDPAMAQIVEGEEPQYFFMILKALIISKGSMSSSYKISIEEKGIADEISHDSKTALYRVQGTSLSNMQAIQVDQVPGSLNSSHCYILKTENSTYTWIGNLSSERDHDLLDRMLALINPTWQAVLVREGNEPDLFWTALGGKAEYPREKKIKEYAEDPRLFLISSSKGDFKVKEIFNFSQDDLTTEDVLVLNCHSEIYVWVGRHSSIDSKQTALDLGLEFLEKGASVGQVHPEIPIYVITEGCEPHFFTRFFEWDSSKANMLGNSFERKLAILKGKTQKLKASSRSSWKAYSTESSPGGLKGHSNGFNRTRKSLSPVPRFSSSSIRSSDIRRLSTPPPSTRLFTGSPDVHSNNDLGKDAPNLTPGSAGGSQELDQFEPDLSLANYPYEQLTVQSSNPAPDIDITRREAYLCEEEFQQKFGMPRKNFYQLPKWKQNKLKMSLQLF